MIKYSLNCKSGHNFESWFASSKEYERLKKKKLLSCPDCNSKIIKKSIMSPNLSNKSNKEIKIKNFQKKLKNKLIELRNYVQKNCKYVGDNFTQEARSIHYDKKKSQGIYGKATPEETAELAEEGIEVSTIPWVEKKEN